MKKLALGLLLTAGICGNAWASEGKRNFINEPTTCFVQVVVNVENACGVYLYSIASPKSTVNCLPGQKAGTTTTYYERRHVSGWNTDSINVPKENCIN